MKDSEEVKNLKAQLAELDALLQRAMPYLSNTPDLVQHGAEDLAEEIRSASAGRPCYGPNEWGTECGKCIKCKPASAETEVKPEPENQAGPKPWGGGRTIHRFQVAAKDLIRLAKEYSDAEPSAPKCKGWTCFHCDEHFTDAESASIHFGTHEIQRPACLINAAEYRSMEERVRECANEDSELHRQLRRQASNHKLELQRAEESGYAKGLADASAPIDRDELPEFARTVIAKLVRFRDCAEDGQGVDIGRNWFDTLVQLGLLHRVQRSPAMWEITCEGDALLESRAALERNP